MSDKPHATGIATEKPTDPLPPRFLKPRYWGVWFGMGLLWLLLLLPQRLRVAIGARLGDLFYLLSRRARYAAARNIELCFPELNDWMRHDLLRRHFRAFGAGMMAVSLIWWASVARLKKLIRFRDREHYDRALAAGKNVILLAPHFLALEVAGYSGPRAPHPDHVQQPPDDLLDWLQRARACVRRCSSATVISKIGANHARRLSVYYLPTRTGDGALFAVLRRAGRHAHRARPPHAAHGCGGDPVLRQAVAMGERL